MASLAETFFKLIILLLNFSVIAFMVLAVVVLAFIVWRMIVTAKKIHEEDKKECGTMTPQVDQFIRDFKSCAYWCKHLIWLNEQLEVLEHELTWGRHSSVDLTPEQLKTPLPMPSNTSRRLDAIDWQVWEEKERGSK